MSELQAQVVSLEADLEKANAEVAAFRTRCDELSTRLDEEEKEEAAEEEEKAVPPVLSSSSSSPLDTSVDERVAKLESDCARAEAEACEAKRQQELLQVSSSYFDNYPQSLCRLGIYRVACFRQCCLEFNFFKTSKAAHHQIGPS